MKTMSDEMCRAELIERLYLLDERAQPKWGKMSVVQMMVHCNRWDAWVLGKNDLVFAQSVPGWIFGKFMLRRLVRDDKPMAKNLPAGSAFVIRDTDCDFEAEKKQRFLLIDEYRAFSNYGFVHDFFGKMSREEIEILAYKHNDHHLRQFGC